jgi:hypothetical protein
VPVESECDTLAKPGRCQLSEKQSGVRSRCVVDLCSPTSALAATPPQQDWGSQSSSRSPNSHNWSSLGPKLGTACISPIYDLLVCKTFRNAPTVCSRMTANYQVGNSFRHGNTLNRLRFDRRHQRTGEMHYVGVLAAVVIKGYRSRVNSSATAPDCSSQNRSSMIAGISVRSRSALGRPGPWTRGGQDDEGVNVRLLGWNRWPMPQ